MKKVELEAHDAAYQEALEKAKAAERNGMYRVAMGAALSCWEFVDGMIQYQRKYKEQENTDIEAIDMVLRYAPLLLDSRSLHRLEKLLAETKRIVRNSSTDVVDSLSEARSQIWDNHRLWNHLEQFPDCRQEELRRQLGGDQDYWRSVVEAWEKMGLVQRKPDGRSYRVGLATRLGQLVSGKCPLCGGIEKAPKAMFLESVRCPKCRSSVSFVILSS
jgi:hypothetical protein